jgi:hypothetical protein
MKKPDPKKLSIEFDKKQYEALMRALQITSSVYDILSDMVDERFDAPADELGDLESWVLAKAGEFGMANIIEIFEGKNVLKDDATDRYTDDLTAYEEWAFWDVFAHKLADREMARRQKKDGAPNLSLEELLDLHIELEEKYEKEFDEHGLDHVEIKED